MNGKENIVNIDVLLLLLVQRSDFRNAKSCGLKLHAYEMQCPASSKFRCVYLLTHTGRHHYKPSKYKFYIACKLFIVANYMI